MSTDSGTWGEGQASSRDFLAVARRRKWIILQAAVLVPLAAILYSLSRSPVYEASAEVLLTRQNLAAALTGTPDQTLSLQPERLAQTQAQLARVPTVIQRALRASGVRNRTASDLAGASSVSASSTADFIEFNVRDRVPTIAARLATAYAHAFTVYRQELDTAAIKIARRDVGRELEKLRLAGEEDGPLYASLLEKNQQLQAMETLQTTNTFVVRSATTAAKVSPRPVRSGLLALVLGLILGVGLAFLFERVDIRVRSVEEIHSTLGLPLLGTLPARHSRKGRSEAVPVLTEPNGMQADAFRRLRTSLDFVNLERGAKTIMVTSALRKEGKSTVAANLAAALGRAGRSVVLVDLDLRVGRLSELVGTRGEPGLTNVALGEVSLEEALVPVLATGARDAEFPRHQTGDGPARFETVLGDLLPAGSVPPDIGDFVTTHAVADILKTLRERADVVVIDSPPLLGVSDAMMLSANVDALLVVSRLKVLTRPALHELRRVLDSCPAHKLGVAVVGVSRQAGYGPYGPRYGDRRRELGAVGKRSAPRASDLQRDSRGASDVPVADGQQEIIP